jgi:hypothetical protein
VGEVERQIPQRVDHDLVPAGGELVQHARAKRPAAHAAVGIHRCASRRLPQQHHFAEAHPARQRGDPLVRAVVERDHDADLAFDDEERPVVVRRPGDEDRLPGAILDGFAARLQRCQRRPVHAGEQRKIRERLDRERHDGFSRLGFEQPVLAPLGGDVVVLEAEETGVGGGERALERVLDRRSTPDPRVDQRLAVASELAPQLVQRPRSAVAEEADAVHVQDEAARARRCAHDVAHDELRAVEGDVALQAAAADLACSAPRSC